MGSSILQYPAPATNHRNFDLDKVLIGVSRSKIRERLQEVGFDDKRQSEIVGGLSGGWKMKLELARAMLYNADLLLLDEVRSCPLAVINGLIVVLTAYQSRKYTYSL